MPACWGSNDGDPRPRYQFHVGPLEPGGTVATFDFGSAAAPPAFAPRFQLVVSLGDPEARWLRGKSLGAGLAALGGAVMHLLNFGGFAPLLGSPPV